MEVKNQHQDLFSGKLIIILSEDLQNESHSINIQDYIENGKSFIPVFSSVQKFDESTKGSVTNPKIEIDGLFLLSLLNGNETFRINPGLDDEAYYKADGLLEKYSENIEALKLKMKDKR